MPDLADALRDPIALGPNRVARFYRGGRMLDAFRGQPDPADDDRPEDWVGSATRTWTPPRARAADVGLSRVQVGGQATTLESVLRRAPEALIGPELLRRSGPTLGLLVKLLDAGERLPVHCHPDRPAAARLLDSAFGKTEAWIILGTRDGPAARIWAGFREPVAPTTLRGWIDEQDTDALLAALVEHRVTAGDAFLIPAGTPHAIGSGVFLLELQEPTDFSVVAETRGFPITEADATLGLGWDRAIGLFDTSVSGALRQEPAPASVGATRLLGADADPYFGAMRVEVGGGRSLPFETGFAIGIVLSGSGEVRGARSSLSVRSGDTFALPAACTPHARLVSDGMELILCVGPVPRLAPAR